MDNSIVVIKHTSRSKRGTTIAFGEAERYIYGSMRNTVQVNVANKRGYGKCEIVIPVEVLRKMITFAEGKATHTIEEKDGLF